MPSKPVVISLPIEDRRRAADFYQTFLGSEPFGAPADDGIPEPLQFALNDGVHLMLVPRGGFGWVIGDDRTVATTGTSECVLSLDAADAAAVDAWAARGAEAGGKVVGGPGQQPWGYVATIADPDDHIWMIVTPA